MEAQKTKDASQKLNKNKFVTYYSNNTESRTTSCIDILSTILCNSTYY